MKLALTLLGILLLLLLAGVIAFRLADRTNGTLISAGEKRKYLLYVPESYDPSRPVPLVITIHGFAQWPAHQMHISRWNELAEEQGFIVVYPAGTRFPKRWRTGGMPGSGQDTSADVQFISDLIDKLQTGLQHRLLPHLRQRAFERRWDVLRAGVCIIGPDRCGRDRGRGAPDALGELPARRGRSR